LLQVAASHGAVIVSDEPYEMYCYGEQPCFLSAMSGGHGVLTVHTFSKTLGTGLRLGYVQAQPEWLEPLQKCSNINGSIFWEYAVGEVMASGRFQQIVSRSKEIYARKIKVFCEVLEAHVGRHLACPPAQSGGFFVWIELASLPADEVNLQMINMGVEARLGRIMYGPDHDERSSRDGKPKCCHIGFAFIGPSEKELVEAAKRVGAACQAVEDGKLWRPGPAARL
jgi:DNA-binding transcriptional MocR family regulator